MDRLLPNDITWTPYKVHQDVCPFEDISLFSGWISRATIPSDTAPGYMSWYFRISHPYIVRTPARHSIMPAESDGAMLGILASIRNILKGVMHNDEVPNCSRVYNELESAYTLTFENTICNLPLIYITFARSLDGEHWVFAPEVANIGVFATKVAKIWGVHSQDGELGGVCSQKGEQ
ncbi:hypothetical protein L195_g027235 [Trifolium pratense]|uniref:Aminotransferase-like plant mobile domain-containing protein n=1 Tax=Trifolium pratense TaxID=57577 RepID=A0A2K3KYL5_TRIPR|nr:hypothetical protein L195_g027235 [Trifolium pratense]